jgi:hypothetical protein
MLPEEDGSSLPVLQKEESLFFKFSCRAERSIFMPNETRKNTPKKKTMPGKSRDFPIHEINPTHENGKRNQFCPFYCNCSDYAVESSWDFWTCSKCRLKAKKTSNETAGANLQVPI